MSSNKRCHDMPSDDLTSIRPWQTNATERWQPQEHQTRTRTSLLSKAIALSNNRGRMTPILVTSGTWVVATRMQNRCVKCQHPAHHMWVVVNDALLAWVVHASVPLATRLEVSDAGPNAGSKEAYSYDWLMSSHDEHDTNKSGTSHHEQNQEQVMNMSGTSHDEKTNVMNMWQIGHRKQNQAINMSGTSHYEQIKNKSWTCQRHEQVIIISHWTIREQVINQSWILNWNNHEQVMDVLHEQVTSKSWTSYQPVMNQPWIQQVMSMPWSDSRTIISHGQIHHWTRNKKKHEMIWQPRKEPWTSNVTW